MKWVGGLLGFVALLLALFSLLVTTDLFWKWFSPKIIVAVNDRVNGQVTVEKMSGNPLTALVFENVLVRGLQGEVLRADQLQISLSLLSFLKLAPEINIIKIRAPQLSLRQDQRGRWNVTGLLKKRPPPPFAELRFPDIIITQGEVRLTRPGQELQIRQLDLDLDGVVIKHPGRLEQTIQVQHGHLAFTPAGFPRLALESKLSISTQELRLDELAVILNDQPVGAITGTLTQLDKLAKLNLDLRLLPLSGKQARRIWSEWPLEQEMSGNLELTGEIRHLGWTGKLQLGDCHINLHGGLNYENSEKLDYRLNVRVDSLRSDIIKALAGSRFPAEAKLTPLGATLDLSGTGRPWAGGRLQSSLKIESFRYDQAEVAAAQINFDLDADGRQQLKAQLQGNFGVLSAQGAGRLVPGLGSGPGLKGELELKVKQLNPALLAGPPAPAGRLEGGFTGKFDWPEPGNLSRLGATGNLSAQGTLQGYNFQELQVNGLWQQEVLKLSQARLRLGGLRADLRGSVQKTRADLDFTLGLSPQAPWPFLPVSLRGELQAQGSFTGAWSAPHLRLTATGRGISWDRFSLATFKLSADSRGWPPASARLELTGKQFKSPWFSLSQVQLTGQGEPRQLAFDLQLHQAKQSVGQVSGTVDLQRQPYLLLVNTCWFGAGEHQLRSLAPIQLRFMPGFELAPAAFRYREANLNLSGGADAHILAFRLGVEHFPVDVLSNLWPSIPPLKGALDLQAEANGSLRSPIITGKLTLSPGRVADFQFHDFKLGWTYASNQLRVDGQLVEKAKGPGLLVEGQIPLSLSLRPLGAKIPENGLLVRLRGEKLNLAYLAGLTTAVEAAQSDLDIQAQITGSLKNPQLAGKVKWGPGFFKLQEAGVPYDLAPGELRLEQEKISLPGLKLTSGAGQASLSGTMTLAGLQPQTVNGRLEATNFLALKRAGSRAVAHSQINLTGTWPKLAVQGQVTIPEAQVGFSLFRSEGHPEIRVIRPGKCTPAQLSAPEEAVDWTLWKNLLIKLDIKLPGKVWVREKDLKAEMSGEIKVIKIPPRPLYLAGKIRALQGNIILKRKVFDIEHAFVTFPGTPQGLILLDARARHEMKDLSLIIIATGPVTNPRTQLESMPPLSQPDILSYLLFDRPASAITRDQAAMGILGGITADKMKDIFGDVIPLVGSLHITGGEDSLGVGKKLTKDITVSYERNLDPLSGEDINQFRVEYQLNKYLSLENQFGRRNPGGDLFLNFDF
ncbi:MAG: translocation/assembly module TamB domain-containing protein [Desulfobacca sp.]|nr:translocation/assembly module TamB domain-containing protein [Desulfobacca sp.]